MHSGKSASINDACTCSGCPTKQSTARLSTSPTRVAPRNSFKYATFGSNHRCEYRCPSKLQRHGGPPPRFGVQGENTGFSYTEYIKHEMYWTAAIAWPTV